MPSNPDDFEIKIEPGNDDSVYVGKDEYSSQRFEELVLKLDKLMDRLKLVALEVDKRYADLEIKIGKLEERFKDIIFDFPKVKERTESVEDQLNVVNLGIIDFKKNLSDMDVKIANLDKLPSTVESKIVGQENRIKKIDDDIQRILVRLGEIETIKGDVTKNLQGILETKESTLKKEISDNMAETEHLKKSVDALSTAIKSFERTVELTNIDDIIKRFDSLDRRIMDLENAIQHLRSVTRESTITESDVEVFKQKLKEISTTVMNALDRMNKFEMTINSKLSRTEELSQGLGRIDALKSVTGDVREQVKVMRDIQVSVQDLYGKIMRIYDSGKLGWDRLQNVSRDMSELEKIKTDIEDLRKIVEWLVNKQETRLI